MYVLSIYRYSPGGKKEIMENFQDYEPLWNSNGRLRPKKDTRVILVRNS